MVVLYMHPQWQFLAYKSVGKVSPHLFISLTLIAFLFPAVPGNPGALALPGMGGQGGHPHLLQESLMFHVR